MAASLIAAADSDHCFYQQNWPAVSQARREDGHADAVGLPVTWSEKENVVWKTPIHDKGWSSPVIWGDQIWMTTAKADGTQMFAVCVDREDGRFDFDLKVFDVAKPEIRFTMRPNSYASPSPNH